MLFTFYTKNGNIWYPILSKKIPKQRNDFLFVFSIKIKLTETGLTVVIRQLRPEFKFPAKIEMYFSQILAIIERFI